MSKALPISKNWHLIAVWLAALTAGAPGALADEVYLANGDRISGTVTDVTDATLTVSTAAAGTLTIDRAQVSRVEPADALAARVVTPEPPDRWAGEVGAGYGLTTGNTETSQLDGRVAATWKHAPHEVELKADVLYGSKDKKMNAQKYYEKTRYSRSFGEALRWNVYAQEEGDHDRFADIYGRITPAAGAGYWVTRRPTFKLLTECGVGVTHTNYRSSNKKSTTELVAVPRLYAEGLVGKVKLIEDFTLYPTLTDAGEYRWKSESSAEYPLSATVSAKLSAINEYNSDAPADKKKSDWRLVSTILRKF